MIVVLCDSFEQAQDAYDTFVSFLEYVDPWSIRKTYNCSYCVETDDDLRYIFIDYRMRKLFYKICNPDCVDVEEFFQGLEEYYGGDYYESTAKESC